MNAGVIKILLVFITAIAVSTAGLALAMKYWAPARCETPRCE